MMALGLIGTLASTVVGMMGAQAQADAASAQANYQAAVARNNAVIAEQNAQQSINVGEANSEKQDTKTAATVGSIKAAQAANGIDVNSGSPLDVRTSQEQLGRLDTLTIMNDAMQKAYDFRAQKTNFLAEAQLQSSKAQYAQEAGGLNVASSLIGGISSFSSKWTNYQMSGIMT
jgi:hypothetical protein